MNPYFYIYNIFLKLGHKPDIYSFKHNSNNQLENGKCLNCKLTLGFCFRPINELDIRVSGKRIVRVSYPSFSHITRLIAKIQGYPPRELRYEETFFPRAYCEKFRAMM